MKPRILLFFLVFLASVAISTAFLAAIPASRRPSPESDYVNDYAPAARNLLAGKGLIDSDGKPAMTYPPGYPIFLAGSFSLSDRLGIRQDSMVIALGVTLYALSVVMVGSWACRVWEGPRAMLAVVLWAIYPLGLWLAPLCGSEILYIPVLLGGCLLFWIAVCEEKIARVPLFLAGLFVGATMLTRPIALPVPLILAALLLGLARKLPWRSTAAALASFLLAIMLLVAPWEAWMVAHCGKVLPLSDNGPTTLIDGLAFAKCRRPRQVPVSVPADVDALMTDISARAKAGQASTSGEVADWVLHQAGQHPAALAKLLAYKAVRCWYATDSHRLEMTVLLLQVPFLGLAIAGGILAWRRGGAGRRLAVLAASLVLGNCTMTMASASIARYQVPLMPLLLLLTPAVVGARPRSTSGPRGRCPSCGPFATVCGSSSRSPIEDPL
jgi:4-amino-4-deoxy-L-arabinose transferase-like glycosyltransferase